MTPTEADIAKAREIASGRKREGSVFMVEEFAIALAQARAEGRAEGREEAAKIADERTKALEAVAVAYERWEADLIMDNDCWRHPSGMPMITPELWDRHTEIQSMRNDALGRFK